jgi:branched-chain amino acid transport system substrate-binding protein
MVVAAVAGSLAYVFWSRPAQSTETIRIGVIGDLDMPGGKDTWQGAALAAEQINAEGGILGKNITIVGEDDDSQTPPSDIAVATNALTKLITVDKADYIIAVAAGITIAMPYEDICSQHKKIIITVVANYDNLTQRVLDNYDKYKYYFRVSPPNATTISSGLLGDIITVGNYTGFTRVALLFKDSSTGRALASGLSKSLPNNGFQIVYNNLFPSGTTDFTSYLAAIETAGAEILVPYMTGEDISFVKEWYDRQSPTIVWGILQLAQESNFWNLTEGKCDTISTNGLPAISGYPLTNKTLPTHDAYIQRWKETPTQTAVGAYDALRFILPAAIERAGTTETEAVIKALEKTDAETSCARHFVFTSSHDVMVGSGAPNNPAENYMVMCYFQWQNGTQVPVKPEAILKEAGATYKYPPWQGPWSNKPTP